MRTWEVQIEADLCLCKPTRLFHKALSRFWRLLMLLRKVTAQNIAQLRSDVTYLAVTHGSLTLAM